MQNTDSMMELLSGYEAYSSVEAINLSAASEAPATTWFCAGSLVVSGLIVGGASAVTTQ